MRADGKAFVLLDGASGVLAMPVAAELPAQLLPGRRVVVAGDDAATWLVVGLTGGSVLNVANGLAQLDAAGDVPDAQLAARVARTDAAQTFTAAQKFGGNAGFGSPVIEQSRLTGVYLPRLADLNHVLWLDELDEFALLTREPGRTATVTPAATGGVERVFQDDATSISWATGVSPFPVVIEVDCSANPILTNGSVTYVPALTFRSTPTSLGPTSVKVEVWNNSTSAYEVRSNAAVVVDTNVVKLPYFSAPSPYNIYKLRLTLERPEPIGASDTVRIQRVLLYHPTATRDPWHLHRLGGTVHGAVTVNGALATAYATLTANATLGATHSVVGVDATGGARTITLPSAVGIAGRQYTVKRISGGANAVTVAAAAGQTIDGAATHVLGAQWQSVRVVSDGAGWLVV